MKFYSVQIVIEKEPEDPGYFAWSPTLKGCFSSGLTVEEARQNMREALALHLSSMIAHGQDIPPDNIVEVEEMAVAVAE